jgi:hypothetical protein
MSKKNTGYKAVESDSELFEEDQGNDILSSEPPIVAEEPTPVVESAAAPNVVDTRNWIVKNTSRETRRVQLRSGAVVDVPPCSKVELLWDQEVVKTDGCTLNRIGKLTEA